MTWVIIVTALAMLAMFGLAWLISSRFSRRFQADQMLILQELATQTPQLIEPCMTRIDSVETMGVAAIIGGQLVIKNVLGTTVTVALKDAHLTRETTGIGWYPWIGKAIFVLETPKTQRCAIGVKQRENWRKHLTEKCAQPSP